MLHHTYDVCLLTTGHMLLVYCVRKSKMSVLKQESQYSIRVCLNQIFSMNQFTGLQFLDDLFVYRIFDRCLKKKIDIY